MSTMRRLPAKLIVVVAAACSCFFLVTHAVLHQPAQDSAGARCVPRERDALLAFKRGINGTYGYGSLVSTWQQGQGQDCCEWAGVTCSKITGHVHKIDLGGSYLEGQISSSLLSLENLEYLNLNSTYLVGPRGHVPAFLGSLKNLRHLDLSYVPFSGSVPPQLANLTKLEHLDLSFTSIHGCVPEFLASLLNLRHLGLSQMALSGSVPPRLANLSKLEYLDLSKTPLSVGSQLGNLSNLRHLGLGFIQNINMADISWLTHLHFLEYVDMSGADLSTANVFLVADTIPSLKALILANCSIPNANQSIAHIINLKKLEQLDLSGNYLGHPIETSWFWNLTSIKDLILVDTHLYGPFPSALGGITSLRKLVFNSNGNTATMTVDLKSLCDLEMLRLDGSLASGNVTEFIEKLPQCPSSKLWYLSSSDNNLTGVLPDMAGHLSSLTNLFLCNNSITGAIPSKWLENLTSLQTIDLSLNQLSGHIPTLSRNLTSLDISVNHFSGPLPLDFGGPNLEALSLSSNKFDGHVPATICLLHNLVFLDLSNNRFVGEFPQCSLMPNMTFLLLNNNTFSGNFPWWIQNCSMLKFLDLAMNKFNGTLPVLIGDLVSLSILDLSHNMFSGHIPVNITNLVLLQHLCLASNNLSGSVPWSLSKLIAMTQISKQYKSSPWNDRFTNLSTAYETNALSVVMKGQERNYGVDAISRMVSIDLSRNNLIGEIPNEITSLNGLLNLNLSCNHLSGKIPEKIGAMKSLESLDLSRNDLSGEIPSSLSAFTYLSSLDLSYNNLTGRIPRGRQLDTLYTGNPSMFDGNVGLCGPPLERNCSGNNVPEHTNQQRSEKVSEPLLFFYLGLGSGHVVGLWLVFCALLFKKALRVSYFRFFDEVHDRAYVFVVVSWGRFSRKVTAADASSNLHLDSTGDENDEACSTFY